MRYSKYAASLVAGVLSLSLGLAGCGGAPGSSSTGSSTDEATEEDADTLADEDDAAFEEDSELEDIEFDDGEFEAVLYYGGVTDAGFEFLYLEDEESGTAGVVLYTAEGLNDLVAYNGPESTDGEEVIVEDIETGESFVFTITDFDEDGLTVETDEYGIATLKPVSSDDFDQKIRALMEGKSEEELGDLVFVLDSMLTEDVA